jgi:hypothetical protein
MNDIRGCVDESPLYAEVVQQTHGFLLDDNVIYRPTTTQQTVSSHTGA